MNGKCSLGFFLACLLALSLVMPLPLVFADDDPEDIRDTIDATRDKIKKEQKALEKRNAELDAVSMSLSAAVSAVRKTQSVLLDTKDSILRKELEIELSRQEIALKQAILASLIREAYLGGSSKDAEIILGGDSLSDVFDADVPFERMSERINTILDDVELARSDQEKEKQELEQMKKESEAALAKKNAEKEALAASQNEIKGDVAQHEATLQELQEKLAELESDLNAITGKSYNAKDIKGAVEFASSKTDVPKGVLYGFLKMETNLGANTGQCTYKEVEQVSVPRYKKYGSKYKSSIALLYKRRDIFYELVDELGYNKNKKVSCSPKGYIGQGGAMGVPQFMSDVWQGYESSIRSATGHANPDPWNLTDGVMAMALKLRKAGATSDGASVIKKASINYLGTFYKNYYDGIVYWSKNYKRLFD